MRYPVLDPDVLDGILVSPFEGSLLVGHGAPVDETVLVGAGASILASKKPSTVIGVGPPAGVRAPVAPKKPSTIIGVGPPPPRETPKSSRPSGANGPPGAASTTTAFKGPPPVPPPKAVGVPTQRVEARPSSAEGLVESSTKIFVGLPPKEHGVPAAASSADGRGAAEVSTKIFVGLPPQEAGTPKATPTVEDGRTEASTKIFVGLPSQEHGEPRTAPPVVGHPPSAAPTQVVEGLRPAVAPSVEPPPGPRAEPVTASPVVGAPSRRSDVAEVSVRRPPAEHEGRGVTRWVLVAAGLLLAVGVGGALALGGDSATSTEADDIVASAEPERPPRASTPAENEPETELPLAAEARTPAISEADQEPADVEAEREPADVEAEQEPAKMKAEREPPVSEAPATPRRFPTSFIWGHSQPQQVDSAELERLVSALAECPGRIDVVGHTCDRGSAEANKRLGKKRARRVANLLHEGGLDRSRFVVRSAGASRPVESNTTRAGRAANRRVTVACRPK